MANSTKGVVGFWFDESTFKLAAQKTREAGFKKFEAITPFPIHGLDEACGLKRSWIPWVTFAFGLTGCALGWAFQYYVAAMDWPLIIGGKPYHSLPAFIPVMFELTILLGALSSVIACLFIACRLPKINPPVIDPDLSCSKFALFVPEDDVGYESGKVESLFRSLSGKDIRATEF